MTAAVSVVVPVYNTSRYLKQCIESLTNQSLTNIELIFVDDGSTDNSTEILKEYQSRDNRINVLYQENQYAGVARNLGMANASGKYIIFLDSDDFFDRNMLRDTYNCAEKNQAEVVIFGYREYDDKTNKAKEQKLRFSHHFPKGLFTADDLGENAFSLCNAAPWNKLILKEFIDLNHLQFEAVKKCNDTYFVHMAIALAKRIVYINKKYVNYRTNNQASLQGARDSDRKAFIDVGISVKKGLNEVGKYNGTIKKSEIRYAESLVAMGTNPPFSKDSLENFYLYAKEHLFDLFESPEDFKDSITVKNIHESADFSDFLCRQLQAERNDKEMNYVRATSWEVRIGRFLLAAPKKALRIFMKQ